MAFREVAVTEIREVLRAWLSGAGLRQVAAQAGVDRKTARRYVEAAVDAGLARHGGTAQLTDESGRAPWPPLALAENAGQVDAGDVRKVTGYRDTCCGSGCGGCGVAAAGAVLVDGRVAGGRRGQVLTAARGHAGESGSRAAAFGAVELPAGPVRRCQEVRGAPGADRLSPRGDNQPGPPAA